jgi:hypothetical protein
VVGSWDERQGTARGLDGEPGGLGAADDGSGSSAVMVAAVVAFSAIDTEAVVPLSTT